VEKKVLKLLNRLPGLLHIRDMPQSLQWLVITFMFIAEVWSSVLKSRHN
jgi:hypothetical protein